MQLDTGQQASLSKQRILVTTALNLRIRSSDKLKKRGPKPAIKGGWKVILDENFNHGSD